MDNREVKRLFLMFLLCNAPPIEVGGPGVTKRCPTKYQFCGVLILLL